MASAEVRSGSKKTPSASRGVLASLVATLGFTGSLACSDPAGAPLETAADVEALLDAITEALVDRFVAADQSAGNARLTPRVSRTGTATVDCPGGGALAINFDDGRADFEACGLATAVIAGTAMFTFAALADGFQARINGALAIDGEWAGSLGIRELTVTRDRAAGRTCYSGSVLLDGEPVSVESRTLTCAGHEQACSALFGQPASFAFDRQQPLPSDLDPAVTLRPTIKHEVMFPRHGAPLRPELFLFLPGTNAAPRHYQHVLEAAAFAGYRSIGLAYENSITISEYCDADAATYPTCSYDTRKENQTGADLSDRIKVEPPDSIEARLVALLEFLELNDPAGGWGAYQQSGVIQWENIVVAGHSQGAGQSALIATENVVARAIYFSNPGDAHIVDATTVPPTYELDPWSAQPRMTPVEAQFSLHHAREVSSLWVGLVFDAVGLSALGPIVDDADGDPLYQCSHTLSISDTAADFVEAHNQTSFDSDIPLTPSGRPVHNNAYLYLLTATPAP